MNEKVLIKYDEVSFTFEQITNLLSKMETSINNLQMTFEIVNDAWTCENSDYLQNVAVKKLNSLKEEKRSTDILIKKMMKKLVTYYQTDEKVINMLDGENKYGK